ncbi:MAG: dihydroorotate dehydrogenase electron transfer subunit [Candidatus Thermoplasmatota archaeon]
MNQPRITEICSIKKEAENIFSIAFDDPRDIKPGQFYMIWIPGVDEIPMSVSSITDTTKMITFRILGDATKALASLHTYDKIGIRGPYGNGFTIAGKSLLFVGGGTGVAMLAPAVEEALRKKIKTTVIIGTKTESEIFFDQRLHQQGAHVLITTDDGSRGIKGFASDLAKDILEKEQFDGVLTCGPEIMMKKLLTVCDHLNFQASLERYMKCAVGICGQCCIGEGMRVCVEGPVFDKQSLKKFFDFGIYTRDASGKKIKF